MSEEPDENPPEPEWPRAVRILDFGCNTLLVVLALVGLLVATPFAYIWWDGH